MIKGTVLMIFLLLIGGLGGYFVFQLQTSPELDQLSPGERLQKVVKERDEAIELAMGEGVYKCCIEPPCTMCYSEANQWNNYQAGTCACDDLIVQGKQPCPQCKRGLCKTDGGGVCQINGKEGE